MDAAIPVRQGLDAEPGEPPISAAVRRFLVANGVREHNHASEIARIIAVDRSQSYRRLKGDVAWSHTDLRTIARHFGAPAEQLLPQDELPRATTTTAAAGDALPASLRLPGLRGIGLLVPGPELGPDDATDLVAVRGGSGWEVYLGGDEPQGLQRHAVGALTLRSHALLQVALLEDDQGAACALVDAFRPLGIAATPFADAAALTAAVDNGRFDAFVLDWLLAEGNASEVVAHIRLQRPHVPVVVVTGALSADAEIERVLSELSTRWNFSTFDKPVRPLNLANAIKQLVSAARQK